MRAFQLVILAIAAQAWAGDDPLAAATDKALVTHRAGDAEALRALAAADDPDPWLVADELCARGEYDAAEAFAKAAPRKDTEKLPAYVASRRGKVVEADARAALGDAHEALVAKDFPRALRAIDGLAPPTDDIVSAQLAYDKGLAQLSLERFAEGAESFQIALRQARELGWLAGAAEALKQTGVCAYRRFDVRAALAAWEELVALDDTRGDRLGGARALGNIGSAQFALGRTQEALGSYERALRLTEELGDEAGVAQLLTNIGALQGSLGDYAKMLDCAERARKMAEEIGDRERVAGAVRNIAYAHSLLGHHAEAIEHGQRALKLTEELGDRPGIAATLGILGNARYALGEYPAALECQERAMKLFDDLGDRAGVANALRAIGVLRCSVGDYLGGLERQERALKLMEETGNVAGIASTLGDIGNTRHSLGDYPKALEYHERALRLKKSLGDRSGVAVTLGNIGGVHYELADFPKALEYQERALRLKELVGDRAGMAATLGNIGLIHLALGDYPRAFDWLDRARRLGEEIGNRAQVARTLVNIGCVELGVGDHAKALECYERALRFSEGIGDRGMLAVSLGNLGGVYNSLGDHAKALSYCVRALAIDEELGDRVGAAKTLGTIGSARFFLGDYPGALECDQRALEAMEELGDRAGAASMLGNIGVIHRTLGDYPKALDYLERAVAEAERLGMRDALASSLLGLATTHLAQGDPGRAAAVCRRAVEVLGQLSAGLAEPEGAGVREQYAGVFDIGALAALVLHDSSQVSLFLESGRALTLLESLGGRHRVQGLVPQDLRREEAEAHAAESVALAAYRRAVSAGADVDPLWKQVERARRRVIDATRRIQREAKSQAAVAYPEAAPLDRIQATLRPGEALVTYALLPDDALALVATREAARIVSLGKSEAIAKVATALVAAVLRPDERGVATPPHERLDFLARRLRTLVVEPLGLKDTTRLLVAPHAELAFVPFALLAPELEVAYVPSGTTYGVLLDDAARRGEGILAVGDPPAPDDQAAAIYRGGEEFAPLPASRAEAQAVGDVVLVGKDATETGFVKALAERPRWHAVHLACHGLVRADLPELSCLALGADDTNDGFLTVLEVFRLKVPSDLVVLSACETAKGKVYKAEGVIGLTRAFMLAGSPRVICSLWKVDDEATRELMTTFYKEWKPAVGAAAALRRAQQHVASQEKWKDPYFWAAWQLWGLGD